MRDVLIDLTGCRFGKWTVAGRAPDRKKHRYWYCLCDCGRNKTVGGTSLVRGMSTSCGCHQKEVVSKCNRSHGCANSPLHKRWMGIRGRVANANNPHYGAKGVKICPAWDDFSVFKEWAENNGYSPELTIDRIDSDGDYCPSNCRWIPEGEQNNNTSSNIFFTIENRTQTLAQWVKEVGNIKYHTAYMRLKSGKDIQQALGLV